MNNATTADTLRSIISDAPDSYDTTRILDSCARAMCAKLADILAEINAGRPSFPTLLEQTKNLRTEAYTLHSAALLAASMADLQDLVMPNKTIPVTMPAPSVDDTPFPS